jgi:hypothetical protein
VSTYSFAPSLNLLAGLLNSFTHKNKDKYTDGLGQVCMVAQVQSATFMIGSLVCHFHHHYSSTMDLKGSACPLISGLVLFSFLGMDLEP